MTSCSSFKLLDLFCGEGLAAWGYWLSGRFSEIVGVDCNDETLRRYSFDSVCADALTLDYEFLSQFDFIHASPPCQAYSRMTPDKSRHPKLIARTHLMCVASGLPYVIENVEGSGLDLKPNLVMDGHWVGLPIERRRYFYVSLLPKPLRLMRKMIDDHSTHTVHIHGKPIRRAEIAAAMGLDAIPKLRGAVLTIEGMEQGVPPAFTKFIAELVLSDKVMIG